MSRFIAVPAFNTDASAYVPGNAINVYSLSNAMPPVPGPAVTIPLTDSTRNPISPNSVLLYRNHDLNDAFWYLFVADGNSGIIYVYDFSATAAAVAAGTTPSLKLLQSLNPGAGAAIHMAVQPGTGNLYASFAYGGSGGSIQGWSRQQSATTPYSGAFTFHDLPVSVCANLAFDLHGNLWASAFNPPNDSLYCFTQVDGTAGSGAKYFVVANGAATSTPTALPASNPNWPTNPLDTASVGGTPQGVFAFSQPEGIAFDPLGNLWVANNNDGGAPTNGAGNGTLVMLRQSWIADNVTNKKGLTAGSTVAINATDTANITVYYQFNARYGGLFFDGFELYVHDQSNYASYFDSTHAVVWWCTTSSDGSNPGLADPTEFFPLGAVTVDGSDNATGSGGVVTSYPGNGTVSVFSTYASGPAQLVIRDGSWDCASGFAEPDVIPAGDCAWESPDLGATETSEASTFPTAPAAGTASGLGSDNLNVTGAPFYVQVCVTNFGGDAMTGKEVLKVYWGKASAGLDWPVPFDGEEFDASASGLTLGGFIGAHPLGVIAPGTEQFYEFKWTTVPDSSGYSTDDGHFCLVARIETESLYPYAMSYAEQTVQTPAAQSTEPHLKYNAIQNGKIGWRNIHIEGSRGDDIHIGPPKFPIRVGILGANYAFPKGLFRFAVQMLDRDGRHAPIRGEVTVHAQGRALERLREAKCERHVFEHMGADRFRLHDPARGVENVPLHAGETLPFHLEFTPAEEVRDFALRVTQYVDVDGVSKVVGGQTFVIGKVAGFPVRERRRAR